MKVRRSALGRVWLVLPLAMALGDAHPAWASVTTKQVSVTSNGGDPTGNSGFPMALSAGGRYVAFTSSAGDLVPGDHTRTWTDVFVRDVWTGTTVRASVDMQGGDPDAISGYWPPSISADGRYVAFWSWASDLVPGDGNGSPDIFVRDLVAETTIRASVDVRGGDPNGTSGALSLSADGRYLAFSSEATDLVQGQDENDVEDVFLRDLVAGTTTRLSLDVDGGDPDGRSIDPSISADGSSVSFTSTATDLVPEGASGGFEVFVRDLVANTTSRVSVDMRGGDPNGTCGGSTISADGRYVVFHSWASDLLPGDTNDKLDVYVRDLVAGTTTRVSVDTRGRDPGRVADGGSITPDGRYVAFWSLAADLIDGDRNEEADIFVRDLLAGTTTRVSVDVAGRDANGPSHGGLISADGRFVAYYSLASDLVPGSNEPGREDVFIARMS
jgi:Tol biopolymer transport system component